MAFKDVIVTMHNIRNVNNGDDPGNALEVFGRFDASTFAFNPESGDVVTLDAFNLFDHNGDNALEIAQGTEFVLNSSHKFQIHTGEFLKIAGHLGEQDDLGPNDPLGSIDQDLSFDDVSTGPIDFGPFVESDQTCSVHMSLQVTAQG
jgi:hypothetical protein